jgi:PEP-CTERM motif
MALIGRRGIVLFASACLFGASAQAGIVYNESVSGDLSGSGLSPTPITVALGSNQVFGTTGRVAGVVDLDYFRFTVPVGEVLTGITILPGTAGLGPLGDSFIGMQAGSQVTVLPSATDATGLLGWFHYDDSDVGTNILPLMATSGFGSTGFTPPLPAGSYSFWVQELSSGTAPYGFDFTLATPEPASWAMLLAGLALIGARAGRKRTAN